MRIVPVAASIVLLAVLTTVPSAAPWRMAPALAQSSAPLLPADASPPSAEAREAEQREAWQAAAAAAVKGPTEITLRDQAKLAIPRNSVFIPQAQATRLSRSMGNHPGPNFLGMVTTLDDADQWMVFVTWTPEGFVKDDEANDLDAATLLEQLREGQEKANKDRIARGFPALELTGWLQPPRYHRETHQLAWALGVKTMGDSDPASSINFNTRALGREGYLSLNLVTGSDEFAQDRSVAETLLTGLQYESGKRYADFNASTDHVAEYGLLALIGVVAAKKLGLLAIVGIAALKFAKVGVLGVAGIGLAARKLFRRKPKA